MRRPSLFMLGFLCLCFAVAAPTWAQVQSGPVYVSGGPYVYNVLSDNSLQKVYDATLITPLGETDDPYPGPHYSSLAIGPDNVDVGANGNAEYPFVVYACDDHTNTILRFVPNGAVTDSNPAAEILSTGNIAPSCGRITSTGDFYFTSGSAVYKVTYGGMNTRAAYIPFNNGNWSGATITAATPSGLGSTTLQGITQKNVGDLLLVDKTGGQVLKSAYGPPFGTATQLVGGLSSPVGIARISTGDIFVSQNGSSTVGHFTGAGGTPGACSTISFPAETADTDLFSVAASEADTVYVVSSVSGDEFAEDQDFANEVPENPGQVWEFVPGQEGCNLQSVVMNGTELQGVAVAPIPTASMTETVSSPGPPANPTPTDFNFGSSDFQITANGCSATVTAWPLSLVNVNSMIGLAAGSLPTGGTPIVNLGEGGYEIAYVAKWPSGDSGPCSSVLSDGTFGNAIFGFYDASTATNPRILRCESSPMNDPSEPFLNGSNTCVALGNLGSYPLGGPLKGDPGVIGHGTSNSVFVLINANPASGTAGAAGNVCNFLPPNNLTLDTDDFLLVAFQLAQSGGNCKTGPFIRNAQALLSVAEIADASNNPTFNPILNIKTVLNLGTTFPQPGLCKYFPHSPLSCTYALILNVQGSGLVPGTYELSVQFLTGNAPPQSVVFKVLPEGSPGTF